MLTQISEEDFANVDPIFRVIVHDHPRRFGKLSLPSSSHQLGLCWRSDLIDPIIVHDPVSSAIWVGVDQRLVSVSPQGNVLFSVALHTPILQLKLFDDCVIVLCETEVLGINRDLSLRRMANLREVADTIDFRDGKLLITFVDGSREAIPF